MFAAGGLPLRIDVAVMVVAVDVVVTALFEVLLFDCGAGAILEDTDEDVVLFVREEDTGTVYLKWVSITIKCFWVNRTTTSIDWF